MKKLIQLFLVAPAILMTPFGWLFLSVGYTKTSGSSATSYFVYAGVFVLASSAGIFGLISSILVDTRSVSGEWRRRIMAALIVGLLLDFWIMVRGVASPPRHYDVGLFAMWLLLGPLIVGTYQLERIISGSKAPSPAANPENEASRGTTDQEHLP